MFQFTNLRQQRENSFNQHAVVPLAASAKFQIFQRIYATAKTRISQNNRLIGNFLDARQKFLIGDVRRFKFPIGDKSEFVGEQAKFAADNPFPRDEFFFADALSMWLVVFSDWMTQLDAVRIDHAEESRFSQKLSRYLAMRFQTAKKPCAFGQTGKKIAPVLFDPSVKGVLRNTFESKQKSERNRFADRKFSLNMFRLFSNISSARQKSSMMKVITIVSEGIPD